MNDFLFGASLGAVFAGIVCYALGCRHGFDAGVTQMEKLALEQLKVAAKKFEEAVSEVETRWRKGYDQQEEKWRAAWQKLLDYRNPQP